jgi:hypothetical protein
MRSGVLPTITGGVLVAAAVESVESIVENSREAEAESPGSRRDGRGELDAGALRGLIERDAPFDHRARRVLHGSGFDPELRRVEHDLRDGLPDLDGDGFLAAERRIVEIGLEPEVVPGRHDSGRQSIVHVVELGHGIRLRRVECRRWATHIAPERIPPRGGRYT